MARLIDTTLRLLGQNPLAGQISTARVLDLATELDQVGFHALEVSGGGCFRAAVARGIESPWERIRVIRGRVTRTPLALALRGTFLVGNHPADSDLVRRFILCAADSGVSIFRLHDPLNDVEDLRVAAETVREAGARLYGGLVYADAPEGEAHLVERARALGALGADRVMLHDPAGRLTPTTAGDLVGRLREAAGVPVGIYCQGPGGTALAVAVEAARAGADPIATAAYRVAVPIHRPAGELLVQALHGLGLEPGVDLERMWGVSLAIDEALGADALPPVSPHGSLVAALNRINAGLVALVERRLAALGQGDRRDEVLAELHRVRLEVGQPPTASPIGGILIQQAIEHVLSGRRWQSISAEMRELVRGEWGTPPGPVDPVAAKAATEIEPTPATPIAGLDEARARADGLAASEEELCLVALFGEESRRLLERLRGRAGDLDELAGDADEGDRVRELISVVEESGIAELTVEEDGVRITVRRHEDRPAPVMPVALAAPVAEPSAAAPPADTIDSPMVGVFYRAASPEEPAFVEAGQRIEEGQTLCLLEAMKLFNELKADRGGVIRRVLVENGAAVEFGQPLFELEPA